MKIFLRIVMIVELQTNNRLLFAHGNDLFTFLPFYQYTHNVYCSSSRVRTISFLWTNFYR